MKKKERVLDEMEKTIIIKSIFYAWISLEAGLFIFSFVYSVAMQKFDLISAITLIMAIASLVVFFTEKHVMTREMTIPGSDEDEE